MVIGLATAFPIILVMMLSTLDIADVMNAGWPALDLLYQVTQNKAVTIGLTIVVIVIYICA